MLTLFNQKTDFLYGFICLVANQPKEKYTKLFDETQYAQEKEIIVFQTIQSIALAYKSGIVPAYSKLNLPRSRNYLADSFKAFNWLAQNKYLYLLEGGWVDITYLLLAKLMIHFSDQIPILPVANQKTLEDSDVV